MATKKTITVAQRDALKSKLKKRRKLVKAISLITFIILVGAAVTLFLTVNSFKVLPAKYITLTIAILAGLGAFMGLFVLFPFRNGFKVFQSILCVVLAGLMIWVNIMLPVYKGKIEKMFVEVPTEGELAISFYVLTDDGNGNAINSNANDVSWLSNKLVGTQKDLDLEYQEYAIKVVNKDIKDTGGQPIRTSSTEDIYDAVDKLYAQEVSAIMLNESYIDIIAENADYQDFTERTKKIYTSIQIIDIKVDNEAVKNMTTDPFIIGVIAQDSWNYADISKASGFRSDVNMIVVVNPTTRQVLLVTLPRDSYLPLYGQAGKEDKLTHSPMYKGVKGWQDTVGSYMKISFNYYLRVNFTSLIDIVNAIGGIDVQNAKAFSTEYLTDGSKDEKGNIIYQKHTFEQGLLHLDGPLALIYARERKHLTNGDMGRNEHQTQVFKAIVKKCCSVAILKNAVPLLDSLQGKFTTNLTFNDITAVVANQLENIDMDWEIISYNINGKTGPAPSYMMSGRELSMVFPYASQVEEAKSLIKKIMNNEVLPVGE